MSSNPRDIVLESNLKRLLIRKNLSLHKASKKAQINKSSLHNYLNGVLPQGLVLLVKLSHILEVSLDELVFDVAKPPCTPCVFKWFSKKPIC